LSDEPWARGFVLCVCLGLFAFVFYEFKQVSPGCLGTLMAVPDTFDLTKASPAAREVAWEAWRQPHEARRRRSTQIGVRRILHEC
jgi:hypothetical protein